MLKESVPGSRCTRVTRADHRRCRRWNRPRCKNYCHRSMVQVLRGGSECASTTGSGTLAKNGVARSYKRLDRRAAAAAAECKGGLTPRKYDKRKSAYETVIKQKAEDYVLSSQPPSWMSGDAPSSRQLFKDTYGVACELNACPHATVDRLLTRVSASVAQQQRGNAAAIGRLQLPGCADSWFSDDYHHSHHLRYANWEAVLPAAVKNKTCEIEGCGKQPSFNKRGALDVTALSDSGKKCWLWRPMILLVSRNFVHTRGIKAEILVMII